MLFHVPNAPCGVESSILLSVNLFSKAFLMHRVELKADYTIKVILDKNEFLMHRVELKGGHGNL